MRVRQLVSEHLLSFTFCILFVYGFVTGFVLVVCVSACGLLFNVEVKGENGQESKS